MSSRNQDHLDNFIERCLKNWLWQQEPPLNSKEKLLRAAFRYSPEISENINLRRTLAQYTLSFLNQTSLLFFEQTIPPQHNIINSQQQPSMQRSMFRTFTSRMEFLQLIV